MHSMLFSAILVVMSLSYIHSFTIPSQRRTSSLRSFPQNHIIHQSLSKANTGLTRQYLPNVSYRKLSGSTSLDMMAEPSLLLSVADYAAEVMQNTVSTNEYTSIFQAGILLFLSGVISTFIAALIITQMGNIDDLYEEYNEGKEDKLQTFDGTDGGQFDAMPDTAPVSEKTDVQCVAVSKKESVDISSRELVQGLDI
jgi:hypothetical protein